MSFEQREYLRHILEEAEYLLKASERLGYEDFVHDETLRRAFVRSLEIIGEATKKLPPEFFERDSDIPWRNIARMRDRLIHAYFGVDYEIVWDVVSTKIGPLRDEVASLLTAE